MQWRCGLDVQEDHVLDAQKPAESRVSKNKFLYKLRTGSRGYLKNKLLCKLRAFLVYCKIVKL